MTPIMESAAVAVGISATKAVVRTWIKDDFRGDLVSGVMDALGSRIPDVLDRRRAARQFDAMVDTVAKQLLPILDRELASTPEHEVSAATHAVSDTLDASKALDFDILARFDFEPTQLEAMLRSEVETHVRSSLSESGQVIYDRLLRETCNYVVELTTALPSFQSDSLVEIMRRESELSAKLQEALQRLPQVAETSSHPDADFDLRYRRYIARELDHLELFGITLDEGSRRYDLSVAYIALSANLLEGEQETQREESLPKIITAPASVSNELAASVDEDAKESSADTIQIDMVLSRASRHLIRGEAGSGKTTLLQWLAVAVARDELPEALTEWANTTPIFLQLRRYSGSTLPSPEQFLDIGAPILSSVMPTGWMDRHLSSGRALLLIDGVDELPDDQRQNARDWLYSLLREFPECKVVVTTRPSAVPEEWLGSQDFAVSDLLPMSMTDITRFVSHWYEAAKQPVLHRPEEVATLSEYERRIVRVIRDTPAIRNLAATPLLCAMLCALYKDRRTQLPADRLELYRIALETLLERRDVERRISENETISLTLREKEVLLEDLAYWLIRGGRSDVERENLLVKLADRISFMKSINASAEIVYRHLLVRSGLLREPVEGRVDFIHRTFQEYLAAARAVKQGDIQVLLDSADDDQWRETIILAAGHASPAQADQLLSGLIEAGNRSIVARHRMHLLAAACLETALELSPPVTASVEAALAAALPPTNMTEAKAVASAGALAAPLLRYPRIATTAAACVRSLSLIGGESALQSLETYAKDRRKTVIRELIRSWDYFDKQDYAARVLSKSPLLDNGTVDIQDVDALAAIHHLRAGAKVRYQPQDPDANMGALPNRRLITALDVFYPKSSEGLGDLSDLGGLSELNIYGAHAFQRISDSMPDGLKKLTVANAPKLVSLDSLTTSTSLTEIRLEATGLKNLSILGGLQQLKSVYFRGGELLDLRWVSQIKALETLNLTYRQELSFAVIEQPTSALDLSGVDNGKLSRLVISGSDALLNLDRIPNTLRSAFIHGARGLRDINGIRALKDVIQLSLWGSINLADFGPLSDLTKLDFLDVGWCKSFDDLSLIARSQRLRTLHLSNTSVSDLGQLGSFPRLRQLQIFGSDIRDLSPLVGVRQRLRVVIDEEQAAALTPELEAKHTFRVLRRP